MKRTPTPPHDPAQEEHPGGSYDALDEALMETFPASDPTAVDPPSPKPHVRPVATFSRTQQQAPAKDEEQIP